MSWLESDVSFFIFQRISSIVLANTLEELYCQCLQRKSAELVHILGWLRDVGTDGFVDQIIKTYARKRDQGEHALVCNFPVDLNQIIINEDNGTISLTQHVHIEWGMADGCSTTIDDFTTEHIYLFDGDGLKISNETGPGGRPIRRKPAIS